MHMCVCAGKKAKKSYQQLEGHIFQLYTFVTFNTCCTLISTGKMFNFTVQIPFTLPQELGLGDMATYFIMISFHIS